MQIGKFVSVVKEKAAILIAVVLFICIIVGCQKAGGYLYERMTEEERETSGEVQIANSRKVVIDAGHGGQDPGKIGVNGAKEKEINLQIALKLKEYLEKQKVEVVMTRDSGKRLAGSQVEDLRMRVKLVDEEAPVLAVSIHQNSYPQESVRGAQVFYFTHSEKAKKAAELIQNGLKEMDKEHSREIKANTTYYMLKNTQSPVVIVECGFLSCPEEADMLIQEQYQQMLAENIGNGILKYVESQ